MGDRANVFIREQGQRDNNLGVYLYTHWSGSALPKIVKSSLIAAKGTRGYDSCWDDGPYLASVIFREMGGGNPGLTGLGISCSILDNSYPIIHIDCDRGMVGFYREGESFNADTLIVEYSFEDYVNREVGWPKKNDKE